MKKLLLISEPGSGGVKKHVIDLIRHIDKKLFRPYLIYSTARADKDYLRVLQELESKSYVKLYEVSDMQRDISPKKDFSAFVQIYRIIKEVCPDIVHCHSSKAGVLGRLAARAAGAAKIIYTPHAYIFQNPEISGIKRAFFINLERFMTCFCTDFVVNVAHEEREFARKNKIGNKSKFCVIHNGIEQCAAAADELRADQVVCVARMDRQKNPIEVLKIAEVLQKRGCPIPVCFVGDGACYDSVVVYAKERKISNVHFLGYQSDVRPFLKKSILFLSTSRYESCPYTLLESLSCGTPILCSDVIGNRELTIDEVTGWRYPLGSVDKAAQIIIDVIERKKRIDPDDLRAYVNDHYSISQMIKMIERLYLQG